MEVGTRRTLQHVRALIHGEGGFTFVEVIVALTILSVASIFIFQAFVGGIAHAGRSNADAAATTLAMQIMEQVRASVNPYTMVGFADLVRTPLPLPAPYAGVVNPAPYSFEAAVDVTQDANMTLTTVTVEVYRVGGATPMVRLTTVLDDQ